jgi:hypothetical protein
MPNPAPARLSPEGLRRQRARNWALFGALLAFVVIIFLISIVKMGVGR